MTTSSLLLLGIEKPPLGTSGPGEEHDEQHEVHDPARRRR